MRSLWRTTTSLLRKYPILWLPVVLAELLTFNLRWIEGIVRHWLIQRLILLFSEQHSVLSSVPFNAEPDLHVMTKVIYLAAPLEWGARFVYDVILACALVATAAILRRIAQSGIGTLRQAIAPTTASSRRVLIFCLKLYGLSILVICAMFPISYAAMSVDSHIQHTVETAFSLQTSLALEKLNLIPNLINYLWTLPIALCAVYIVAPWQLRLIQPIDFNPTPDQKKQSRLIAIYVAVAIGVLGIVVSALESALLQQPTPGRGLLIYSVRAISSQISALPTIPLYIALYLIANPDSPLNITPETPLDLPSPPESPPPSTAA